jgi:hypothetical protein
VQSVLVTALKLMEMTMPSAAATGNPDVPLARVCHKSLPVLPSSAKTGIAVKPDAPHPQTTPSAAAVGIAPLPSLADSQSWVPVAACSATIRLEVEA